MEKKISWKRNLKKKLAASLDIPHTEPNMKLMWLKDAGKVRDGFKYYKTSDLFSDLNSQAHTRNDDVNEILL